ncbi:MAG: DUF262 domain-containing protein [Angustibacter sp.]
MSLEPRATVEVRPEVVFLYELLEELTSGRIRIPRFQREYVWRRDQMTDLLDSVHKQYPVGSLLVWETDEPIATLETLGPFANVAQDGKSVGYLLDGHQRLMTLSAALIGESGDIRRTDGPDSKWRLYWNLEGGGFQHSRKNGPTEKLFPMTALLDTLSFFSETEKLRGAPGGAASISDLSQLARTFQSYRIPVIRIKKTELSEAVEIFARLNSKGQSMTADQMVSALTYQQDNNGGIFSLAGAIDHLMDLLGRRGFADVDRTTVLRAVLANLDEDIYKTDWTKFTSGRRAELQTRLEGVEERTRASLDKALNFLNAEGVLIGRLLPYGLQLVLLSAFFDRQPDPSPSQLHILRTWFWASSFSAWFGGANPSRATALLREFREDLANAEGGVGSLRNFDLAAVPLPFPSNFDMRSARTRVLLLVMLDAGLRDAEGDYTAYVVSRLAEIGPPSVGNIFYGLPKEIVSSPANRMFCPRGHGAGRLAPWLISAADSGDHLALETAAVDQDALVALKSGDKEAFIRERERTLQTLERAFQQKKGLVPGVSGTAEAPVDTE